MIGNKLYAFKNIIKSGMTELGWGGMRGQFPPDQLNLSQPRWGGGRLFTPPHFYLPPRFSVLLQSLKDIVMKQKDTSINDVQF